MQSKPRDLVTRLRLGAVLVLDGGLATELERLGLDLRDELWSARALLERPELVTAVHQSYLRAGADVITTASYQATPHALRKRGLSDADVREMLLRSVHLATDARDRFWTPELERAGRERPLVAASIGSYGAYLANGAEYCGDYALGESELAQFHRERFEVLAASAADVLAFETVPSRVEARALARLVAERPGTVAWLSFSGRDAQHIADGTRIAECAAELESVAGVIAVGVNCTAPHLVESLLRELRSATRKPLVAYPNSGESWNAHDRAWSGHAGGSEVFALAPRWIDAGARLIGGCCRTRPNDIARLRELLGASTGRART